MFKRGPKKKTENADGTMPLTGHLKELRNRIIICVICLVVFFMLGLSFAPNLVKLLTGIGEQFGYQFVYIAPQELLLQYFGIAMIAGVVMSVPVLLYHIWGFIQPGLKENENRMFGIALAAGMVFFLIGVAFAYFIMLPFMLRFLIQLSKGSDITASVSVANYVSFLLTIFVIMGVIFELPVVCVTLTSLGLLKVEWMIKARKFAIIIIFLVAAIVTPPDVVSQCMVAIPMLGLYQFSILICKVISRRKKNREEEDSEE